MENRLPYLKWIRTRTCYRAQGTLLSVMWPPGWEGVWGRMGTCVCVAEAPCCSPETITTLLIGYTPIQNKKQIKRKQAKFTNAKTCI